MPEAVVLIRKELGKDAVILSTKKVRVKKWLGLWRQTRIEVLAAVGKDVPVRSFDVPIARPSADSGGPTAKVTAAKADSFVSGHTDGTQVISVTASSPVSKESASAGLGNLESDNSLVAHPDAAASIEATAIRDDLMQMRQEMAHLKKMLESSLTAETVLKRDETSEPPATPTGQSNEQVSSSQLDAVSEAEIMRKLVDATSVSPIGSASRLVMFVGPTGVGKTTTIAKLAALQVLAGRRKVGLITTDTFRIAAVEQLKTYAGILGVPLEVVSRVEEMAPAIERLKDRDLILIDTAGRNFEVQEHTEHIQRLLRVTPVDELYLVLALTAKLEDMHRVVAQFEQLPVHKFLFTKLDETHSYGDMFRLLETYQKPLSYLTTGQNVPSDIEIASLEKVVKLVCAEVAV